MINVEDYKGYYKDNYDFYSMLSKKQSMIFDRLDDFFRVLGYIEMLVDVEKKVDQELEIIFETGFGYLHEQTEQLKTYYNDYFKQNYKKFEAYAPLINYSLYLDDLTEAMQEKGYLSKKANEVIKEVAEEIEDILINQRKFTDEEIEGYNIKIQEITGGKKELYTTQEIFAMVVEELQL